MVPTIRNYVLIPKHLQIRNPRHYGVLIQMYTFSLKDWWGQETHPVVGGTALRSWHQTGLELGPVEQNRELIKTEHWRTGGWGIN